jgi:hypothetical protein
MIITKKLVQIKQYLLSTNLLDSKTGKILMGLVSLSVKRKRSASGSVVVNFGEFSF